MNKTCKIRPSESRCKLCLDTAEGFDEIPDCKLCSYNTNRCEIIQIGSSFWGGYAIILMNGCLEKVSLSRVYDIKEKGEEQ